MLRQNSNTALNSFSGHNFDIESCCGRVSSPPSTWSAQRVAFFSIMDLIKRSQKSKEPPFSLIGSITFSYTIRKPHVLTTWRSTSTSSIRDVNRYTVNALASFCLYQSSEMVSPTLAACARISLIKSRRSLS